jgi:hypothetical protein
MSMVLDLDVPGREPECPARTAVSPPRRLWMWQEGLGDLLAFGQDLDERMLDLENRIRSSNVQLIETLSAILTRPRSCSKSPPP